MTVQSLPPMAKALRALIRAELQPDDPGQVGTLILGEPPEPWYVRFALVTGASDRIQGDFVFDVEIFAPDWNQADSLARDLDARLLRYPHVVEADPSIGTVIIDAVAANDVPHEVFWDNESVHRFLTTYVLTARRQ